MKRIYSSVSSNSHRPSLNLSSPSLVHFASVIVLSLVCFSNVSSQTVKEYKAQIDSSIGAIDLLTQSDESETYEAYERRVTETLTAVRGMLPEEETISWEETRVKVDNRWLYQQLAEFEKSREPDRQDNLKRIIERLQAVADRLQQAEVSSAGKTSKDEARKKLSEILARREYAQKNNEGSALERLIKRILEWLQKLFPKQKPLSPGRANLFTQIAQYLVVLIALAVIAYAIKMFLPGLFKRSGSKPKSKGEARIVLGETLAPDQSAGDLLADAEALARRGELRAAIRKAYIALLVELGERKLISLAQHKTNRDYLRAVRQLEPLHSNLKGLTDSFERHWYGIATATEEDWTNFRSGYVRALTRREST